MRCFSDIWSTDLRGVAWVQRYLMSGAQYVYLLEGFGALPVFLHSWTSVIVLKPSQVAIICLAFGAYVI